MIDVRPSAAGVGYLRGLTVVTLAIGAIQGFITAKDPWTTVITLAIAAVLCFGAIELWRLGSRIRRDVDGTLRRSRLALPLKPIAAVAAVYLPEVINGFGVVVPRLALFDARSRAVLRIGGELWQPDQIEALAHSYAPALISVSGPVQAKLAVQTHPEAFAFRERRPLVFVTAIVLSFAVFCGAIVAIALLTG